MEFFYVLVMLPVACAFYSMKIATLKGYESERVAWFMGGFFFIVIALIAVAGLPDLKLRAELKALRA